MQTKNVFAASGGVQTIKYIMIIHQQRKMQESWLSRAAKCKLGSQEYAGMELLILCPIA